MKGRGLGTTFVIAVVAAGAAPAAATAATTRYAAPSARGLDDCSTPQNACPISDAITDSNSGDTIDILGNLGDYNLGASTLNTGSIPMHFVGVNGTPRLIANANTPVIEIQSASSSASNLYLENDGNGDGLYIVSLGGTVSVDRLFARTASTTASVACVFENVTVTNSICWDAQASGTHIAAQTVGTNTLRNDVAWLSSGGDALRCASTAGTPCTDTVVNTIARVAVGGSDLAANSSSGANATINASYSNFGTKGSEGDTSHDHVNTDATDQITPPALVNPGAGDFHELSTSPTVNTGVNDPANGGEDLDGNPRTLGGRTDIGAYEVTGTAIQPPILTPPDTAITKAKVKKHKHRASFSFTGSGTVTGFQCALVKQKKGKHKKQAKPHFSSCTSGKTYKHLGHGKYTFEARAVNSAGPDPTPATKHFKI